MPGKLTDEELVDIYRRAWILVSASLREGWGMTVTEAGACGTPAVATRIAGHADAVDDGCERGTGGRSRWHGRAVGDLRADRTRPFGAGALRQLALQLGGDGEWDPRRLGSRVEETASGDSRRLLVARPA